MTTRVFAEPEDCFAPRVVSGGILAGDDFESAHAQRTDLQGSLARAVTEMLPGFVQEGNLWYWHAV